MDELTSHAREMRKNPTGAETKLWYHLCSKQLNGLKFRRQEPIRSYIVDFVCYEKKVVIELDGAQHFEKRVNEKDLERDTWLRGKGFKVLRFLNSEVLENVEYVLTKIEEACLPLPSPTPLP